ncbi:hypothetical protein HMPREF1544_08387, partial [Mucor circinelloides 1006PhL]
EKVQFTIHSSSKASSAVPVRFGVICKSSLVQRISGLVLSASHQWCFFSLLWCYLQVIFGAICKASAIILLSDWCCLILATSTRWYSTTLLDDAEEPVVDCSSGNKYKVTTTNG